MAAWPETLPAPAINSLNETPPDNVLRSQNDKGPAKLRRRTTANTRPISFEMNLTKAQVAILDEFYTETTYSGVDSFDYEHPRTEAACTARFMDMPKYVEREGIDYRVQISLEILP